MRIFVLYKYDFSVCIVAIFIGQNDLVVAGGDAHCVSHLVIVVLVPAPQGSASCRRRARHLAATLITNCAT